MKKLVILAAALTAIAPAAFAYAPNTLTAAQVYEAQRYVPNADLSNLTSEQALAIASVLSTDDAAKGAQIYSILNVQ
jgi:hypothetical protein